MVFVLLSYMYWYLFSILYWLTDVKKKLQMDRIFSTCSFQRIAGIYSSSYYYVPADMAGFTFYAGEIS